MVYTTAWLTFARVEGLHAEHLQSSTKNFGTSKSYCSDSPRQLSFAANSLFCFLISVCHAGSLTFSHSLCSFSALSFKRVTLCRSTEWESPPPLPHTRLLHRSEPPSTIVPVLVCVCECKLVCVLEQR